MASPLYNLIGTWSATVQYAYLDSVTYGGYTYICTASGGSLNQEPDTNPLVWAQMPQITQEDQYYLLSREQLLQYEDARFQSLVNAMANYYVVRNDQSIWGSFLRAIAMELARIDYMYSYDVIAKNPSLLTPPDIKRQYSNPLFVTGTFQQSAQFDSGNFGAVFSAWAASAGILLNSVVIDSNSNLQVCVLVGTTGAVEPLWTVNPSVACVATSAAAASQGNTGYTGYFAFGGNNALAGNAVYVSEFTNSSNNGIFTVVASTATILTLDNPSGVAETSTASIVTGVTVDGGVAWSNYGASPAALAYPIGYRDMLVDLLAAYQLGATVTSIEDVIYAYTGKNIVVEELYKQIVPGGFYDQSYRNTVAVSVSVGGSNPLTDIESLTELQQVVNSLSGAIDLAKPAHVGLAFTTVFGADENIDCFISPRFLTQYQLDTLSETQQAYYELIAYVLTQTTIAGWSPAAEFAAGSIIQDANGNIQLALVGGVSGSTKPVWNASLQGATYDGVTSPPTSPSTAIEWINIGTPQITIAAYAALLVSQQPYYQGYYQNLNCAGAVGCSTGAGIDDTLQIIVQQVEEPPFDPMLYQAPIYDPSNPTTTLAAYGRTFLSPLSPTSWLAFTTIPQTWCDTATYNKGDLVRGRAYPSADCWNLYRALKKNGAGTSAGAKDPLTNPAYWTLLSSPSIYQAYYPVKGQYVLGIQPWATSTSFYTGQFTIDTGGNLEIQTAPSPGSPPVPPTTAPVMSINTSLPNGVSISNNLLTLLVNSTSGVGLQVVDTENPSLLVLQGFTYAAFLNGLTLPVAAFTSTSVTLSYTHEDYESGTNAENNATIVIGFNTTTGGLTYDGSVIWENLGVSYLTTPAQWIQVVNAANTVTGEVANGNVNFPMGLLAPRLDLVWELSGGDISFTAIEQE